jgi:hypothetical protein
MTDEPVYHEWPYEGYIEEDDTEYKFRATIIYTEDYLIDTVEVYDYLWDDSKTFLTERAKAKAVAKFNQKYR